MESNLINLVEMEAPFVFRHSYFDRRNKQNYTFLVNLKYELHSGKIIEFTEDLSTGEYTPEDNLYLYNNLHSFFKKHPGVEAKEICVEYLDKSMSVFIPRESLNYLLKSYYTSLKPRKKILRVTNNKVDVKWDSFWEEILS